MTDKIIIANWKQNLTLPEINDWLDTFFDLLVSDPLQGVEIVIAPSYPYLPEFKEHKMRIPNLWVSAQDVSVTEKGSHTGKVGADQLKDYCEYCLVGHSETGDDVETTIQKGRNCLNAEIIPMLCFTNAENISKYERDKAILIWEDPSNISVAGEYNAKSAEKISSELTDLKKSCHYDVRFLYGGSVNRQNALELGNIVGLDGVIVGHASLAAEHFFEIAQAFKPK